MCWSLLWWIDADDFTVLEVRQNFKHFRHQWQEIPHTVGARIQHDNWDILCSNVLLIRYFPVSRDKCIEFPSSQRQQFAVADALPTHVFGCTRVMTTKVTS